MKIFLDTSSIKAGKRHDPNNPITKAMYNLRDGFVSAGYETIINSVAPSDYDVAVVFGSITQRKMDTERAISIQKHREAGKKIISLDSAFFSTYIRNAMNSPETYMFRVGIGDCVGSEPFEMNTVTSIRYEQFERIFKFEMKKPRVGDGAPILFLMQTERGWQYDDLMPYKDWARWLISKVREKTDNHIILRAHPNQGREPLEYIAKGFKNVSGQYGERARMSLIKDLTNVGSAITHSSSAAVECLVEGIPTVSMNKRCITHSITDQGIDAIINPSSYDWSKRQEYFNKWSWTTYHVNEFTNAGIIKSIMQRVKQ